ncbi:unnamed protein product [Ceutorhynchus assimilis]|uniref:Uncharacterized protein n=1 Tax=Ceutorhynchus assimilis TaxID=467358 RepID=A0A9N9MRR5_9CUCU|nr:unnamed protein product [Ceutorhynchus assimilis]
MKRLMDFDASTIPPCQAELRQHLSRSRYIGHMWRHAHLKHPLQILPCSPTESGWKLEGNELVFNWFDGPALPTGVISDIVIDREDSDEDDDEEISNTDVKYEFDTSEDDGSDNEDLGVEETTLLRETLINLEAANKYSTANIKLEERYKTYRSINNFFM